MTLYSHESQALLLLAICSGSARIRMWAYSLQRFVVLIHAVSLWAQARALPINCNTFTAVWNRVKSVCGHEDYR